MNVVFGLMDCATGRQLAVLAAAKRAEVGYEFRIRKAWFVPTDAQSLDECDFILEQDVDEIIERNTMVFEGLLCEFEEAHDDD